MIQESNQRLDLTDIRRVKYLDKMVSLGLPKDKCMILSSGVMVVYGLKKEMKDLDLVVTKEVFKKVERDKRFAEDWSGYYFTAYGDTIEVSANFNSLKIPVEKALKQSIVVDGFRFATLKMTLVMKKQLNRPKDQKDIRLIEKFCKKNGIPI